MERREFVQTMAGAGLAIACGGASRAPRAARIDKIGIQLYTVRDKMKEDVEGTLARIAQIGYKEVEFAGYFNHPPEHIRSFLDKNGLSAPSTHVAYENDDQWKAAIATAKTIGHEYIVMPWIPQER